jgi:nicotinamide riboside kinase
MLYVSYLSKNGGLEISFSQLVQKVALIGAFCTGKTTLFHELKWRRRGDPRFAFVEEASRRFLQLNNFSLVERNSIDVQRKIQNFIIDSERTAYATNASIILCDSSALTTSMYLQCMGDREGSLKLLKAIEFWLPTYTAFLLLDPSDVPYVKDSVRLENEDQRQRNHEAYLELFARKHIPYQLIGGTLTERLQKVSTVLQSAGFVTLAGKDGPPDERGPS